MQAEKKRNAGEVIKKALGVKGDFKTVVKPMLAYSMANIATSGGSYVFSLYYFAFLTMVEGLSAAQVGIVLMIKSLWDAVTDPVMGVITDRTRSKLGKHRPYIYISIIPFALVTVMTWSSFGISGLGSERYTMIYYTLAFMLYSTVTTILNVPHIAMLPQVAPDYFERTQYNSVGYIMNSCGMVPSFLIASCFLGLVQTKDFNAELRLSFTLMGVVLAVFYMIPLWYCATHVREESSLNMKIEPVSFKSVFGDYASVFKNRSFRQFFLISLFMFLSQCFYNNSKLYYISSVAGSASWYNLLISVTGVAEASVFPLNYAITKKYGKQRCAWILMPLYFLALLIDFLILQDATKEFTVLTLFLFIEGIFWFIGYAGIGFTTSNSLSDTTDIDELICGKRREGVLSSFYSFLRKLSSGFMAGLIGVVLEWFGVSVEAKSGVSGVIPKGRHAYEMFSGFFGALHDSSTGRFLFGEDTSPTFSLKLIHAVFPFLFMALAFFFLKRFELNHKSHTLVRAVIATKHKYGSVTPTEEEKTVCERLSGQPWEQLWVGQGNDEERPLERNEEGDFVLLLEIEEENRRLQNESKKRLEAGKDVK